MRATNLIGRTAPLLAALIALSMLSSCSLPDGDTTPADSPVVDAPVQVPQETPAQGPAEEPVEEPLSFEELQARYPDELPTGKRNGRRAHGFRYAGVFTGEDEPMIDVLNVGLVVHDGQQRVRLDLSAHVTIDALVEWFDLENRRFATNPTFVSVAPDPAYLEADFNLNAIKPTGPNDVAEVRVTTGLVAQSGVFPGTNIRYTQALGHRTNGQDFPSLGWFQSEYDDVLGPLVNEFPQAFTGYVRPVLGKSIRWRDTLVNDDLPMTVAEMADHTHPNFVWNQSNRDGLTEALAHPLVTSGAVQVALILADSHSGARLAVPDLLHNQGLSFENSNDSRNRVLRMDIPLARDYAVAWFTAILTKWGNDPGLHSIQISEYFQGNSSAFPNDFNQGEHIRGRRTMWSEIIAAAPLDASGNRVAITQASPILSNGVVIQDLLDLKLGLSQPDPDIFQHECGDNLPTDAFCELGTVSRGLQDAYGIVPTTLTADDRYAREFRISGQWHATTPPNPFGIAPGDNEIATIAQVMWYRLNIVPCDGTIWNIGNTGGDVGRWDFQALRTAISQFGGGGSLVATHGQFPPQVPGLN